MSCARIWMNCINKGNDTPTEIYLCACNGVFLNATKILRIVPRTCMVPAFLPAAAIAVCNLRSRATCSCAWCTCGPPINFAHFIYCHRSGNKHSVGARIHSVLEHHRRPINKSKNLLYCYRCAHETEFSTLRSLRIHYF